MHRIGGGDNPFMELYSRVEDKSMGGVLTDEISTVFGDFKPNFFN